MAKLLRSRQIFYPRLLGIDLPGMQIENNRAALLIDFAHAEPRVLIRKQTEVTAAAKRKAPARHLQNAHWKFIQLVRDLVWNQRRVGDAVVWMKSDRKD